MIVVDDVILQFIQISVVLVADLPAHHPNEMKAQTVASSSPFEQLSFAFSLWLSSLHASPQIPRAHRILLE